jgi:hypothetical protein
MEPTTMRIEGVSTECDDFVTALVEDAVADAHAEPDGFAPFGAVLDMYGEEWRIRDPDNEDPEKARAVIRTELSRESDTARCVAVVWDGIEDVNGHQFEVIYVEVYELGRPYGHIVALRYRRGPVGATAIGQTAQDTLTEPIIALTADLMRRHLDEWTESEREELRQFVEQQQADAYGFWDEREDAMHAFEEDPTTFGSLLEQYLSTFPFGELDTEDAVAVLEPLARYVSEVLIRLNGGRWDVAEKDGELSLVIVVDGDDGQNHEIDPYALVAEYADAPLPPLSTIVRQALDLVHR